jgi:IPT/TIG domain
MLRILRSLSPALAVAILAAPAAAHAAPVAKDASAKKKSTSKKTSSSKKAKKSKSTYPVVTKIAPRKIQIGQKLTITGTNFRAGKNKSSVAFYKSGKPVIFAKAETATTKKIVITVPTKVANLLALKDGLPQATMLRLRVIGAKMGRSWTQNSRSPIVSPIPGLPTANMTPDQVAAQAAAQAYKTCQETAQANPPGDQDGDSLPNGAELAYRLDPCSADTDADGLNDGWEFQSARDLNGAAVPYPGARPWPNPLDPSDTIHDFDGDGLMMWQEFKLWQASGSHFPVTQYSDGTQNSGGPQPVTNQGQHYLDGDRDGNLTDDERDFDGDGISNVNEFNITGTQVWWNAIDWRYQPHGTATSYIEPPYARRVFSDLDATSPDSDGDGIPDGADDQDNDGWPNFVEMQLSRRQSGYRVHPFNPCLPDPHAYVCSRYVFLDEAPWPPFDWVDKGAGIMSVMPGDAIPVPWPAPITYSVWHTAAPSASPAPPTYPTGAFDPASGWAQDVAAGENLPAWVPSDFGSWDPAGWFREAWDGNGGHQGL